MQWWEASVTAEDRTPSEWIDLDKDISKAKH